MASIHQKTKGGTWYISFVQEGRLRHRSLGTKNLREARRLKQEIEKHLDSAPEKTFHIVEGPGPDEKNPDVAEFWEEFLKWAKAHRTKNTVDEYANWFRQFTEFTGARRLGDISTADVERFKTARAAQGKCKPTGVGLDKISINNAIKTLRSIWSHAKRLGLYTGANPFEHVERYRIPQQCNREYLDGDAIRRLLAATVVYASEYKIRRLEARNIRIAVALMALAGLRKREVCYAKWEWIRWDDRIMIVSSHAEFVTKNRKTRTISMHDELLDILRPYREHEGYMLTATRRGNGRNRYRVEFKRAFQSVCQLARVDATPHALRHSFASRHAVAGTPLHVIAGWLGHSSTSVTERYAHFQSGYNAAVNNI